MKEEHVNPDYCRECGRTIVKGKVTVVVGVCQVCYNSGVNEIEKKSNN